MVAHTLTDAIGRSVDKEGNLKCPVCVDPPVTYDLHAVALSGGPKHVFDALFHLRAKAMTSRAVEEGLANQDQRLREEFVRIQAIQVLTLSSPLSSYKYTLVSSHVI